MPAFHVSNEVYLLSKNGYNVIVLNVFKTPRTEISNNNGIEDVKRINLYEWLPFYPSIKYLPFYTCLSNKSTLLTIIKDHNVEMIYSSWSSMVLPEAALIKRLYPNIRWVHRFLMYPASLNKTKVLVENISVWRYLKYADHVMVHTKNMRNYLTKHVHHRLKNSSVVIEKFNESYFCESNMEKFSAIDSKFHLIFIGSINNSNDTTGLHELIEKLSDNIIVHLLNSKASKKLHASFSKKVNLFEKKRIGNELTCFLKKFDGIIALYPKEISSSDRVNNVIPNRISLALPSMTPIFIPQEQLIGAQDQLNGITRIFTFHSAQHLEDLLRSTRKTDQPINRENLQLGDEFIDILLHNKTPN